MSRVARVLRGWGPKCLICNAPRAADLCELTGEMDRQDSRSTRRNTSVLVCATTRAQRSCVENIANTMREDLRATDSTLSVTMRRVRSSQALGGMMLELRRPGGRDLAFRLAIVRLDLPDDGELSELHRTILGGADERLWLISPKPAIEAPAIGRFRGGGGSVLFRLPYSGASSPRAFDWHDEDGSYRRCHEDAWRRANERLSDPLWLEGLDPESSLGLMLFWMGSHKNVPPPCLVPYLRRRLLPCLTRI